MKKIGFVTPWFGENIPGGAEMELRGIAEHLYRSGMEIEILSTCVKAFLSDWNKNYHPQGIQSWNGITVRRFRVRHRDTALFDAVNSKLMRRIPISLDEEDIYFREMINSPALTQYLCEHEQEYELFVFIPYMFGTTYAGCLACPGKAVVIPCLHDEPYAYMQRMKECFSKVRGMIFHAMPEARLAERIYNLSNVAVQVLGEGVDTDIVGNAVRFREKYGINAPFILYAGRKDRGKNVHMLLQYFAEYKKRNPENLKIVLIGGGEIAVPNVLQQDVYDLGFVPRQDKYDAYAASEMLCQPSSFESFSLVIMESWLCGRPVLVNENCAVTRHFAAESNGGLYFKDYWEFEGCVSYLLANPNYACDMGKNGMRFVRENFTWDIIVQRYTQFFQRVSGAV